MRPQMVFLDIDGTIATFSTPPSSLTRRGVEHLVQRGHKVFLCTGRVFADIPKNIRSLPVTGMICSAGSHIIVEGKILFEQLIPQELVKETLLLARELGYLLVLEGKGTIYYLPGRLELPNRNYSPITGEEQFQWVMNHQKVYKFAYLHNQPVGQRFVEYVRQNFNQIPHKPNFGELLPKGINKAVAIRRAAKHLGADIQDTLAIGDSLNDLQMLQCAGTSIAMRDAPEPVLQAADYVTGTLEEDGVYHALRHFHLVG